MAIVADLARPGDIIDASLCSPNRRVNSSPITLVLLPLFSGEIVLNTSNGDMWIAVGTTAGSWSPFGLIA